jgi:hypothetical protein
VKEKIIDQIAAISVGLLFMAAMFMFSAGFVLALAIISSLPAGALKIVVAALVTLLSAWAIGMAADDK